MRFVSYNIHRAVGVDGVRSLRRIADVLGELGPDVVGLNEVLRIPVVRDQPARLARMLHLEAAFEPNVGLARVGYGNLVLARGRIRSRRNIALPSHAERRGLLFVEIEMDEISFVFGVTHLSPDGNVRTAQIETVAASLPDDRPVVLAGDFNARPEELTLLTEQLRLANPQPTFPAPLPTASIDHVLASEHWRFERVFTATSSASDHAALVADLGLG